MNVFAARSTGSLLSWPITVNYATGPSGNMTAGRLQLNPGYYWQISVSKSYPVASKAAIKVKSSVGAGSQTVSFGVFGSETYNQ